MWLRLSDDGADDRFNRMDATGFYLTAVAVSTGITVVAVGALHRPMLAALDELCPTGRHAGFWGAMASICMLLAATVAASFPDAVIRPGAAPTPSVDPRPLLLNAVLQCAAAMGGVLVSLGVVSALMLLSIRRYEERAVALSAAARGATQRVLPAPRPNTTRVTLALVLLVIALIGVMVSIEHNFHPRWSP